MSRNKIKSIFQESWKVLSVERCILELVDIAIKKNPSSLYIRFNPKEFRLNIVDNGYGYSLEEFTTFSKKSVFQEIISLTEITIITSRKSSSDTYIQIISKSNSTFTKGKPRPSVGCTISLYGFNPFVWRNDINTSLISLINSLAISHVNVTFLLENEESKQILLRIDQGCTVSHITNYTENKMEARNFEMSVKQVKDTHEILQQQFIGVNKIVFNQINLSPLSEWSDWNYSPKIENKNSDNEFPQPIHNLQNFLPFKQFNAYFESMKNQYSQDVSEIDFNDSRFYDILGNDSRKTKNFKEKPSFIECRITAKTISSMKIINQFNLEFIAATVCEDERKFLLIVDQHAVHERIRYEFLIDDYRNKENGKYLSVKLNKSLIIKNINKDLLKLLLSHTKILSDIGIHIKSAIDNTSCEIDTIPKCFIKNCGVPNYQENLNKYIEQLLTEIGIDLSLSILPPILPISINAVISREACHEAIKFGEPLNFEECDILLAALRNTKAPTRCAHGRPSIIPIAELSNFSQKISKKLNFASLGIQKLK